MEGSTIGRDSGGDVPREGLLGCPEDIGHRANSPNATLIHPVVGIGCIPAREASAASAVFMELSVAHDILTATAHVELASIGESDAFVLFFLKIAKL